MDSEEDDVVPELTKNETKVVQEVVEELTVDPLYVTSADQIYQMLQRNSVKPEKQLKMMYATAYELSELSENSTGELSDQYLRLSTLAAVAVKEKFQPSTDEPSCRKTRTAKSNAKINVSSYFDTLETSLLNDSDDEKKSRKKQKKDKIVWSDSELVETEPVKIPSLPPIPVESDVKTVKRSSKEVGVRKSGRTKPIDLVCIDSSSEEENDKLKTPSKDKSSIETTATEATKAPRPEPGKKAAKSGKPIGIVKATRRTVTPSDETDSKRNIKEPDELILNFKKGHYPMFQASYTHLKVIKKQDSELYKKSPPRLKEVMERHAELVPSSEIDNYELLQMIQYSCGQYFVAERDKELFLVIPGIINA